MKDLHEQRLERILIQLEGNPDPEYQKWLLEKKRYYIDLLIEENPKNVYNEIKGDNKTERIIRVTSCVLIVATAIVAFI